MSYKIVILESAEDDLKELKHSILNNFSEKTWKTSYQKIKDSIRNLTTFPEIEAIPEELINLNIIQYRQIISGKNRIIYEIRNKTIYIHIITDSRQDFKSLLIKRILRNKHSSFE